MSFFTRLPQRPAFLPDQIRGRRAFRLCASMMRQIQLTEHEETLRQLLLDVSKYIGTQDGCVAPQLRFTGGWVRDKLLGITSKDIDIGIDSMTGFKFGTLMKQYLDDPARRTQYGEDVLGGLAKIEANPEKSKHLETVTTKILGLEIDLVNLRKETYVENSRNPTMEFGTPVEDALRRDSTVNALFYNLSTSKVEDLTEKGLRDMELKVIRTPLEPHQTFKDDPLRVLRCIRFACKLDYEIDPDAELSMGDESIKEALRAKISRERVGIEIDKILRGPCPQYALSLIDRLGLYNTVFTNPSYDEIKNIATNDWSKAYYMLTQITNSDNGSPTSVTLRKLKQLLIKDAHECYVAWLLCSLTPWARTENPMKQKPDAKKNPPMAAVVAREGLKTENKTLKVISDAVLHLDEITASKNAMSNEGQSVTLPMKRKQAPLDRQNLGMAIRRWGSNWRSSVMFAILVETMGAGTQTEEEQNIDRYAAWLSYIAELDLLEAYSLKPVVDGRRLLKAIDKPAGPWMFAALNMVLEWQFRNPENHSPEDATAEVQSRRQELGFD